MRKQRRMEKTHFRFEEEALHYHFSQKSSLNSRENTKTKIQKVNIDNNLWKP